MTSLVWSELVSESKLFHLQSTTKFSLIKYLLVCLIISKVRLIRTPLVENVGAAPLLDVPNIVCYCYTTLSIKAIVYCTWYNRSLINHRTITDSLLLKHVCLNLVPPHRPHTYIFGLSVRCSKPTESLKVKFIPFITLIIF